MAFEDTILINIPNHKRRNIHTRTGTGTNCLLTPFRMLYRVPFPPGFSRFPACKLVLLLVILHRLHIYSTFNFIVGLTATRGDGSRLQEDSTVTAQLFMSCTRLLAPISGIIADMYIPRAKMVSICFFISFIGSSIQSLFHSIYELDTINYPYLYYSVHSIAICLLTVGSSGVYALLVPVGVDQMEGASEMRLKSYFSWHYWSINIGAALAAGRYFIYATHNYDKLTLLASSYLSTLSVWLALVVLMLSLHFQLLQRNKPPGGTPLKQVLGVTTCAMTTRYSNRGEYVSRHLFDYALIENRGRYSYEQVQDVKTFYKILFVLVCMIWYFGVDNLYNSIFPLQGAELSGAQNNFVSTEVIFLADCITILLLIPSIEIIRNRFKYQFGFKKILNKIVLGVMFSFGAILVALSLNLVTYFSYSFGDTFTTDITVIIPQTVLIAISECIAFVGIMEFVYAQSPHQMIGFVFGVLQLVIGIGSYIPTVIYYILQRISNCYGNSNCEKCLVHWPQCLHTPTRDFVYYAVYAVLTFVYILFMICLAFCYKRRERQRIEVWPETNNFRAVD